MITGFFLRIGYVILNFFVGVLPIAAFPTQITSAIQVIAGYMNAWSFIFPVATLLQVLAVAFVYHFAIMAWHYAHLIGRYLRGR